MTIGNDLERRLDSWMQEDATLPDDLSEVLAKLPETPQRRHRWSFSFADLTWRTRTMFNATRVAATIAIGVCLVRIGNGATVVRKVVWNPIIVIVVITGVAAVSGTVGVNLVGIRDSGAGSLRSDSPRRPPAGRLDAGASRSAPRADSPGTGSAPDRRCRAP